MLDNGVKRDPNREFFEVGRIAVANAVGIKMEVEQPSLASIRRGLEVLVKGLAADAEESRRLADHLLGIEPEKDDSGRDIHRPPACELEALSALVREAQHLATIIGYHNVRVGRALHGVERTDG